MVVNYKKSKIYKIVGGGLVYVGSTTRPLSERMNEHRQHKKSFERGTKGGCSSRFVLEHTDATILLIEKYPCENVEELKARERHWTDSMVCVNVNRPLVYEGEQKVLNAEYQSRPEVKEKKNERYRISYHQNKEKEAERKKVAYLEKKEKIDAQHKEYYLANKEKIALQRKLKRDEKKSLAKIISLDIV
jgi:hypothetical protein